MNMMKKENMIQIISETSVAEVMNLKLLLSFILLQ